MNLPLIFYACAGAIVFLLGLPFFLIYTFVSGKHREGWAQRLGYYRPDVGRKVAGRPRIWVHAASVGEVAAAAPIVAELAADVPAAEFMLSTTTATGQAAARKILGARATCVYAPVDLLAAVALALQTAQPDVLVFVETEIWPNWLALARWAGIPAILVNGRISVRSIRGYRRIRPLVAPVLKTLAACSMIGVPDAARIKSLGVPGGRVSVNGNAKYDRLAGAVTPEARQAMLDLFALTGDEPVLVAGSIRRGEEPLLLDTFLEIRQTVPDLICIVAPRHLYRVDPIVGQARARGIAVQMRTGLRLPDRARRASLVILDTLGELQAAYSIAAVVFCGGSLVPLGGQNVLEAAAWGKPVLFGPSMEDFQAEKELLLASGGGIEVPDGQALTAKARYLLTHPDEAVRAGRAGLAMVQANTGAARKHAAVILRVIEKR
jgi:3-deoxy-D-manno-octulosonic-acid transferase